MNEKLIKYMALCLGISMCVYRVSSGLRDIFAVLSIVLFLYLLSKIKSKGISIQDSLTNGEIINYKMMIILVLSMIPNIFFSYDIKSSIECFFDMWINRVLTFWIITMFIKDRTVLINMLFAFVSIEAIESLWVTYQALNGVYRPAGFGGHVMHLAAILSVVFPVLCILAVDKNFSKKIRLLSLVLGICVFAGIIAIQSRGAWLTLLLVCTIILIRYIINSRKNVFVFVLILISLVGGFVGSSTLSNRFKSITNVTTDRSNADRIIVWESSFNMIKDHPITGVGLRCYKDIYDKKYKLKKVTQDMGHSHNNFIQIFAETGIIGFIGFLSFTFFILWNNFMMWINTRNPFALILFGVWLSFTLFGMIDNTIQGSAASRALWYLTGLLVALKSTFKDNE